MDKIFIFPLQRLGSEEVVVKIVAKNFCLENFKRRGFSDNGS